MMATNYFSIARIAGILLLLGLLILLYGVGSIAAQGRLEGMAAAHRGVSLRPETLRGCALSHTSLCRT